MAKVKERGQSLVELGITFVILMFMLSGVVEFGTMLFQYVQLRDAAQEGALFGSMFPYDSVSIEQRIRFASETPINLTSEEVQVFISYPDGSLCEGNAIQVNVVYYHKVFMPFLPQLFGRDAIQLNGEVTDTILNQACNT